MGILEYCDSEKVILSLWKKAKRDKMFPISVEIQLTNLCSYRCPFCAYKDRRENKNQLSSSVVEHLVDDIIDMNIKTVYISGGGEPTLHPKFEYVVNRFYENGIQLALLTNGSNYSKIINVANKFKYIIVHIPSADETIYHKLTGAHLKEVANLSNNIKKVGCDTLIGVKIVLTKENIKNSKSEIHNLLSYNFDYVVCTPQFDYENLGDVVLDNEDIDKFVKREIGNIDGVMLGSKPQCDYFNSCYAIEEKLHALIFADGKVSICPSNGTPVDEGIIGDINENNFSNIWNSKIHDEIISHKNKIYREKRCKICRFMKCNKAINKMHQLENNPHVFFL